MLCVPSERVSARRTRARAGKRGREWGERQIERGGAAARVTEGGGHGCTAAAPRVALRDECAACLLLLTTRVVVLRWQGHPRAPPPARRAHTRVQVRRGCACCAAPFSPHAITCRQTFHTLHACMLVCYRVPMGPSPRCCGRCVGGCATTATAPAARTMLIEAMVAITHTRSPLDTRKHAHRVSCYMRDVRARVSCVRA